MVQFTKYNMFGNVWNWIFSLWNHFSFKQLTTCPHRNSDDYSSCSLSQCNASFIDETIVAILIISTHHYKVNTYIQPIPITGTLFMAS